MIGPLADFVQFLPQQNLNPSKLMAKGGDLENGQPAEVATTGRVLILTLAPREAKAIQSVAEMSRRACETKLAQLRRC